MTTTPAVASEPAIAIRGLVKQFGSTTALDSLDLEVLRGETHGFLGPNGAGKSTTIRVLLGLLKADAGDVSLLGQDPWKNVVPLHRRLAYVPGDVVLWPGLSGGEAIDLLGNLRGRLDETRRKHLIERFELDPTKKGKQYSKGNRQKVAIIAALSSDVELLILDEPTAGLDPLMEAVFQEEIAAEKERGRTILLSSHVMSEVEALADRVSIIRQGKIIETGTLADLRGSERISIFATVRKLPSSPSELGPLINPVLNDHLLNASVAPENLTQAMTKLSALGLDQLEVSPASLEDLFLSHYSIGSSRETDIADPEGAR
ncbi:ABC transporter ATP-binding protein [Flaviflexus ciconiae]|uniref:ABC transporter ATP-binding protein n=1 Tax=Flaviflexus ciconiae TaxID=2496867 RepID=A0A3S9PW63_9ACTO|nr:ABC transporter ATP-binding protein [Flaviflexus ciconiae]AZQ76589.1 ABC transporter ATP-binding protein [Flaviflexus ciconiae]